VGSQFLQYNISTNCYKTKRYETTTNAKFVTRTTKSVKFVTRATTSVKFVTVLCCLGGKAFLICRNFIFIKKNLSEKDYYFTYYLHKDHNEREIRDTYHKERKIRDTCHNERGNCDSTLPYSK